VSIFIENIMFKKIALKSLVSFSLLDSNALASEDVHLFEKDWEAQNHTQFAIESTDPNTILGTYYATNKPIQLTKEMLWDMDKKKAWDPLSYIPHVVSEGYSWGKTELENGDVSFMRWSMQKQWKTGTPGMVIERVTLLNKEQRAIFIGLASVTDDLGRVIEASKEQPLFHVEHGVGGTEENQPTNTWRIVHLTDQKDPKIMQRFISLSRPDTLPLYVQNYIEKDLEVQIIRKY